MSLQQRAEEYQQKHARTQQAMKPQTDSGAGSQSIQLFDQPALGIVDNEIVQVHGYANIPDMSLTNIVSDFTGGWQVPVPVTQVRLFRNITRETLTALLETERGGGRTRS